MLSLKYLQTTNWKEKKEIYDIDEKLKGIFQTSLVYYNASLWFMLNLIQNKQNKVNIPTKVAILPSNIT